MLETWQKYFVSTSKQKKRVLLFFIFVADIASGNSVDWVKGNYHIPITYTIELRDTGSYGFVLPSSQIIPSGQETLDALVTVAQEAKKRGY